MTAGKAQKSSRKGTGVVARVAALEARCAALERDITLLTSRERADRANARIAALEARADAQQ